MGVVKAAPSVACRAMAEACKANAGTDRVSVAGGTKTGLVTAAGCVA